MEAEFPFIDFDELMRRVEDLVCGVVERVLADAEGRALLAELNPKFAAPKRPFRRMPYKAAIVWLKEHGFKKDDGTTYEEGEVGCNQVQLNYRARTSPRRPSAS